MNVNCINVCTLHRSVNKPVDKEGEGRGETPGKFFGP